ncbi:MAG TPA: hypothetical protein PLV87_13455, partial [Opitutaceae bacterium]|nr:hypothetical protein [Opitutaceae bacterium]
MAGSTPLDARTLGILHTWQKRWESEGTDWAGSLVSSRYEAIGRLCAEVVRAGSADRSAANVSDRID